MTPRDRFAIGVLLWSATAYLRMADNGHWLIALFWTAVFWIVFLGWWLLPESDKANK